MTQLPLFPETICAPLAAFRKRGRPARQRRRINCRPSPGQKSSHIVDGPKDSVMLPDRGWERERHSNARKSFPKEEPKKGIETWSLDALVGELLRFRYGTVEYERVWAEYVRRYPEAALIPFEGGEA